MTAPLAPPRVAYCFHDSRPSGASVWLLSHMLRAADPATSVAILPAPSPMEPALREAGFRVEVLALRMGDLSTSSPFALPEMLLNRVNGMRMYRVALAAARAELAYVNSSSQIAPMLAAASMGLPLLVHVHEGWRSRTHGLKRWLVRYQAHGAAFAAREGMRLFGPPRPGARWEFSPNGVDPALARQRIERRAAERARLGLEDHHTAVLFLGLLCQRKGVHDLVPVWRELAPRFPHARLLVGGNLLAEETDPVIRAFPNAPPPGARHLGFVQDAPGAFAAADLFVLPSYGEAMPISISEAMMAGVPVVARNVGDVAYQIGDGRGFLFEGNGPAPLREALEQALADPAEATRRATQAQHFAREHLAQENQQRQINALIEATIQIARGRVHA